MQQETSEAQAGVADLRAERAWTPEPARWVREGRDLLGSPAFAGLAAALATRPKDQPLGAAGAAAAKIDEWIATDPQSHARYMSEFRMAACSGSDGVVSRSSRSSGLAAFVAEARGSAVSFAGRGLGRQADDQTANLIIMI